MGDISFEEQQAYARPNFARNSTKGLRRLVKKWGWAKDDAGAEKLLLIVAGAALILAFGTIFLSGETRGNPPVPKAKIDAALMIPPSYR